MVHTPVPALPIEEWSAFSGGVAVMRFKMNEIGSSHLGASLIVISNVHAPPSVSLSMALIASGWSLGCASIAPRPWHDQLVQM